MAHTASSNIRENHGFGDRIARSGVLVYGLVAYTIGVGALFWLILALAELAPFGFSPIEAGHVAAGILINAGLIALFGLQHSIMARPAFKQRLARVIPEPAERATFVLASGVVLGVVVWAWQPLPGIVWSVTHPFGVAVLWSLFAFGWAYLVAATFVTNHFELFGLRQVWLHFRKRPYSPLPFRTSWMYRYTRHPMMTGVLIGLWAIPTMTAAHFAIAILFSLYIVVGVWFEERDLIVRFGETYREYKRDVAALLPRRRRKDQ